MHLPQFDSLGRRISNPVAWELILPAAVGALRPFCYAVPERSRRAGRRFAQEPRSRTIRTRQCRFPTINHAIVTFMVVEESPALRLFWRRETALPCPLPLL